MSNYGGCSLSPSGMSAMFKLLKCAYPTLYKAYNRTIKGSGTCTFAPTYFQYHVPCISNLNKNTNFQHLIMHVKLLPFCIE